MSEHTKDLLEACELAAKAIRMVINTRPESDHAPTNMGLASVEGQLRAVLARAGGQT